MYFLYVLFKSRRKMVKTREHCAIMYMYMYTMHSSTKYHWKKSPPYICICCYMYFEFPKYGGYLFQWYQCTCTCIPCLSSTMLECVAEVLQVTV